MSGLLLSVDLEDVRDWVRDGHRYRERVPANTEAYLAFFAGLRVTATFFVVGTVARRYPRLIRTIVEAGHELACHSDLHLQLDKQTETEFRADITRNRETLEDIGGSRVVGYRAPTFSLTEKTSWAHGILAAEGFEYSSSVLPAANPLYGWPEFGRRCRRTAAGIWELPMTLHEFPLPRTPIAGGVYFRVLPFWLTRAGIRRQLKKDCPVLTYFHPYDIDQEQEHFMHPDLNDNTWLNSLMYIGRSKLLSRLKKIHDICEFYPYGQYVDSVLARKKVSSS